MEKYDYLSAVESDVREYIENNVNFHDYSDLDEMKEDLNEKLFVEDSVKQVMLAVHTPLTTGRLRNIFVTIWIC